MLSFGGTRISGSGSGQVLCVMCCGVAVLVHRFQGYICPIVVPSR